MRNLFGEIQNTIGVISTNISDGVVEKSKYHESLSKLEGNIVSLLELSGYDYSKTERNPFFRLSDSSRLSIATAKEEAFLKNEKIAICEGVQYWYKIFNDFLDVYHVGFCHDFVLKERGWIEIDVSCLIHSSFSSENKESAKLNFFKQIKTLKDIGFDLTVKKQDAELMNTGNNHLLIQKMFNDVGGVMVSIITMEDRIRNIKFSIHPENLENFCVDKDTIKLEISENLNADETRKLKKVSSEIPFAISNMQGELLHTCGSLVESYFSDMCKTLNFECELRTKHEKRHEAARNNNMLINSKELSIGEKIPVDAMHKGIKEAYELLEGYFANKTSFRISDLEAHRYGGLAFSLQYISTSHSYSKGKLLSEEKMKEMFTTVGTTKKSENLFIEDTADNRATLFNEIYKISSAEIRKFESEMRDGFLVIKKVDVMIDNVADVFELTFEKSNEEDD